MARAVSTWGIQPIKRVIFERAATQRAVAARLGISNTWLGWLVNGREKPSPRLLAALCEVLDEPAEDLFTDEVLALVGQRIDPHPGNKTLGRVAS